MTTERVNVERYDTGAGRQRDVLQLMKPAEASLRAAPRRDVATCTCSADR